VISSFVKEKIYHNNKQVLTITDFIFCIKKLETINSKNNDENYKKTVISEKENIIKIDGTGLVKLSKFKKVEKWEIITSTP
jgi:hypothetical protein